jgi:uncharacterized protein YecE (DUF72 family)
VVAEGAQKPARLYVGTSGWSYPKGKGTWDGIFYPPQVADRDKIAYYAQFFDAVELNSSFYRPPSAGAARGWAEKVGPDFRFAAKLWQKFTHPKMFEDATGKRAELSQDDFDVFVEGVAPLAEAHKLGPILAQFPPSFRPDQYSVDYLDDLVRRFFRAGFRLAVELRHADWTRTELGASARQVLEEHDVAWVMIDEPRFKTSIRHIPLTSSTGYFRFHGRNYKEWWSHAEAEDRYNYLYPASEQKQLADEVREVSERTSETYAFYNNHYGAKAAVNALQLDLALGALRLTAPLPDSLVALYPQELEGLTPLAGEGSRQRPAG